MSRVSTVYGGYRCEGLSWHMIRSLRSANLGFQRLSGYVQGDHKWRLSLLATIVTFGLVKKGHICPMLEILGFASALVIGISLGLIGGGGSILTVPVLVYLIGISPVMATAYSLFIVGTSSLVGGLRYARKGLVDLGLFFL